MRSVDVIVPCFNYGMLLEACIRSVLSQDGVFTRVIVMDDASTDQTETIGRRLAAEHSTLTYLRHTTNEGHIATYNEGLSLVTADYCMILSADDLLTPRALHRAVSLMETNREVGFTYGRDISFRGSPPKYDLPSDSGAAEILSYGQFLDAACRLGHTGIQAPTVVVRTLLHRKIGVYLPELPHTADTEIWLRMAAQSPVGKLNAVQAFRRLHTANMSLQFAPVARLREQKRAFDAHFAQRAADGSDVSRWRCLVHRTIAEAAFWGGVHAFERADHSGCAEYLEFAATVCPELTSWAPWRRLVWKRRFGRPARLISRAHGLASQLRATLTP